MPRASRTLAFAAAAFLPGLPAEAYYHYTYYLNGNQSTPIHARFSVGNTSLGSTVTFIVNDAGPGNYAAGDTFGSLLAEVRQAIAAWNQVSASQLKLVFGGLEQYPQTENTPGADITFTDLPPGLLGYASPNLPAPPNKPIAQTDANGQYIPISRSTVVLTNDTSQAPGPTYQEGFFTTAVHEIGHALGLQHTWTGAAMTPSASGRNTNRARPIDADDVAAMLVLYGAPGWNSRYGSISGRVTFTNTNGPAVKMASVVALPINGPAVSTLTNPDGSYTISGIPTGNYLLYVHPLPPDAVPSNSEGLLLPEDQNGVTTAQPSGAFQTQFYPGTLTPPNNAINVNAGSATSANFSVRSENSVPLYDVETVGYIDPGSRNYTSTVGNVYITVSPGFANPTQGQIALAAYAGSGSMPSNLQSVTILGGFASALPLANCGPALNNPCFYTSGPWMVGLFNPPPVPGSGPRHMVFNLGNDIFVQPNAFTLVQNAPPFINSVNSNGDGTVTVTGNGFASDTTIYFDGLEVPGSFNQAAGSITVTPPPGNAGQTSIVAAYNSDGQNSTFVQYPGSPLGSSPTYTYGGGGAPAITVNTPSLPTTPVIGGFSSLVQITGSNTNWMNGPVTVGFGTSDITVSRVWPLDATHLLANVVVAPNAATTQTEVSVISGFQVATAPFGFQIQPPDPTKSVIAAVVNSVGTQATVYPGAAVTIYGTNLSSQLTLTSTTGTGQAVTVPILFPSSTQVNFQVPQNFPVGPAILAMGSGGSAVNLVLPIAFAPPVIASIVNSNGAFVDPTHSAGPGDILTIQANGLDPSVASNLSRLQVTVGGIPMQILNVNGSQIQFSLNHAFGGSPEPVLVIVDGSATLPYTILAR